MVGYDYFFDIIFAYTKTDVAFRGRPWSGEERGLPSIGSAVVAPGDWLWVIT